MDFVNNIWSKTGLKKEDSTGDSSTDKQQPSDAGTSDQVTSEGNEGAPAAPAPDSSDGTSPSLPHHRLLCSPVPPPPSHWVRWGRSHTPNIAACVIGTGSETGGESCDASRIPHDSMNQSRLLLLPFGPNC